ncbi:ribulose-1,5 bisphosphate carboxylase/oxygenase large subunit N-methyltransferase, chloroplastic [Vitis riparia]|uniref:ribulose-1,5 bisphosphate carboxylase/oxygenase large subunit N-methyltransferase, chloroplastic n=1 Tax=Vitis riparia TaxID=96939 RepID=UPI00155A104E|nr:ribulose-1,5 bisphosphate carboxylase/oxygenase large subunit N-methyltransferase, chloroplastic [Vitis riparia]
MLLGARFIDRCCLHRPIVCLSRRFKFSSPAKPQDSHCVEKDCDDFLPWLEQKAGVEISSVLSIGKSTYGRSLFASKSIQTGDCILKVPYNVQISPDNVPSKINSLLGDEVGNIAKLAIVILVEWKMGQDSEWAPYINRLPQPGEMHSTVFWSEGELKMIQQSSVYQETINQKAQIQKDFLAIKPVLHHFSENLFKDISLKEFMHACALVGSWAWGSTKGLSLIPFADFVNHDGFSESVLLGDEDKQLSEVIADRNYAPGEQVLIRYGKFPNATLLLDFGFTLPYNIYDQVQIQVNIPHHDLLRTLKLELLHRHCPPKIGDVNSFSSMGNLFTIKEVKSTRGKGRGIPQSLRAFARIFCCTSHQELSDLAVEAAQNDGRLARRPLKSWNREIQAHQVLLSWITQLINEYNTSIKSLPPASPLYKTFALRKQMARDLLTGELRVLKSAGAWLENYCATLTTKSYFSDENGGSETVLGSRAKF